VQPRWGFSTPAGSIDCDGAQSANKLSAIGLAAARNKFTPEFINRLDAMVVFQALGEVELRQIAEIELRRVQQRIVNSGAAAFAFQLTEAALEHVLADGTDPRYGARHLKRAIDRLLVQPISNLLATEQVRQGDCLRVDSDSESREMVFFRQAENLSPMALARLAQTPVLSVRTRATVMPDRSHAARAASYANSGMESQAA
jgi:ATP-dependent Clp protease ATP-binding subunit ClpA